MKYLLFILISIEIYCQANGQSDLVNFNDGCDTVNMKEFNNMVKHAYSDIRHHDNFSVEQVIKIVKIYQTFSFVKDYYEPTKKVYKKFIELYRMKFMEIACKILGPCKAVTGLSFYTERYKMYISKTNDKMSCRNYYLIK